MAGDSELGYVSYLIEKGHSFDYIFSLDSFEIGLVLATMEAEREREAIKWQ